MDILHDGSEVEVLYDGTRLARHEGIAIADQEHLALREETVGERVVGVFEEKGVHLSPRGRFETGDPRTDGIQVGGLLEGDRQVESAENVGVPPPRAKEP